MASYIYKNHDYTEIQQRVVLTTKPPTADHRSGYYVGGSQPPLVKVTAKTKRASK